MCITCKLYGTEAAPPADHSTVVSTHMEDLQHLIALNERALFPQEIVLSSTLLYITSKLVSFPCLLFEWTPNYLSCFCHGTNPSSVMLVGLVAALPFTQRSVTTFRVNVLKVHLGNSWKSYQKQGKSLYLLPMVQL